jgi:hypothetical protein
MVDEPQPGEEEGQADEQQPQDEEQSALEQELEERRANEVAFSWQASEFVHHNKGAAWYLGLAAVILVPAAGLAFLHYWIEMGALAAAAVAVLVYAGKVPKTMSYELTPDGLNVGGKEYPFANFRSFGVVPDAEWHSIELAPAKRLQPPISVLFDSQDFDQIVGHLELHLPRVDQAPDVLDRLARAVRF